MRKWWSDWKCASGSQVGRNSQRTRLRRGRNLAAWKGDVAQTEDARKRRVVTLCPELSGSTIDVFPTLLRIRIPESSESDLRVAGLSGISNRVQGIQNRS